MENIYDLELTGEALEKAKKELGWEAKYNLEDRCRDEWNWMVKNPNGYQSK